MSGLSSFFGADPSYQGADPSYMDRTAGLKAFLMAQQNSAQQPMQPPQQAPQPQQSPLAQYAQGTAGPMSVAPQHQFEATTSSLNDQTPMGKFAALNMESQQPGSYVAMQQPKAPEPINPLGRFLGAFIPGVRKSMEQSHQKAVADYVSQIPHDQAVKYMASQDPRYMEQLLAESDPVHQQQIAQGRQNLQMGDMTIQEKKDQIAEHDKTKSIFANFQSPVGTPAGFDPRAEIQVESNGGRNVVNPLNPHVHGPAQFDDATAKAMGLKDPNDMQQSLEATARLGASNSKVMTNLMGRAPTAPEIALAHQQGAAGASALISNPNENAIQALVNAGVHPAIAKKSIIQNGGSVDMTAGEFAQMHEDRYSKAAASLQSPLQKYQGMATQLAATDPEKYGASALAAFAPNQEKEQYKAETAQGKLQQDYEHGLISAQQLQSQSGTASLEDSGMHGPDALAYLQKNNSGLATDVKLALQGKYPMTSMSSRNQHTLDVMRAAALVDPSFDPTQYQARVKTAQAFSPGGDQGKILTSVKTAVGHMATLATAQKGLDNGSWTPINYLGNQASRVNDNATHTALNSFDETADNLAPELAKIVSGKSNFSEDEVKKQRSHFSASDGPGAFKSSMNTAVELMRSRFDSMLDSWQHTMGADSKPPATGFDKKTIDKLQALGINVGDYFDTSEMGSKEATDAPAGVPPELWAHMTPEEQAAFK